MPEAQIQYLYFNTYKNAIIQINILEMAICISKSNLNKRNNIKYCKMFYHCEVKLKYEV